MATGTTTTVYTHAVELRFSSSSGATITAPINVAANEEILGTYPIPAATTNYFIDVRGVLRAKLQDFLMFSATADLSVKTNSSGSPTDTISLKAAVPKWWTVISADPNPLTGDIVTGLYVTNAAAAATSFTFIVGQDPQT